jgi:hypothetical protein
MSYSLILVRVPPGTSEDEIENLVLAIHEAEHSRLPGPPDAEAESRKRRLVEALLEECPELEGGELDYPALARAHDITETEARHRYRWWRVVGPEEGAGFDITLYDTFVTVDMAVGGTDEDWEDLMRYLAILVREGGFTVWDPQGPNVMDVATEPSENVVRTERTPKKQRRRSRKSHSGQKPADGDADAREDAEGEVEPEDARRGGEIGKLINQIVGDALAAPLAAAGFRRSGRTWRRHLDGGIVQVVNVQWSPRRGGMEGWFTLNSGVYFPALAKSLALFPITDSPKEYDCHVRKRPLLPGIGGWTVQVPRVTNAEPDLGDGLFLKFFSWLERRADRPDPEQHPRATRELRASLERHAVPWLEHVSTLRTAREELLKRGPAFWAAHISLLLGERDEAARILRREMRRAPAEHVEVVRRWGRDNGLID